MVGTADRALIGEVPLIQSVHYREVPLSQLCKETQVTLVILPSSFSPRSRHSLFIVGNVVVHHDHNVIIRYSMCMEDLVSMAHVSLHRKGVSGRNESLLMVTPSLPLLR